MIDHVSVAVRDLAASATFYEAVLATIGYAKLVVRPNTVGFGKKYPEFWLNHRPDMAKVAKDSGVHIALRTLGTEAVDAFHRTALAAGGSCEGPPGARRQYAENYYAAFVCDLDGNRIEAVTFVTAGW
jgi:catechol 2,3-dioxygenase-like lactoylglutathione lyase family enzyme